MSEPHLLPCSGATPAELTGRHENLPRVDPHALRRDTDNLIDPSPWLTLQDEKAQHLDDHSRRKKRPAASQHDDGREQRTTAAGVLRAPFQSTWRFWRYRVQEPRWSITHACRKRRASEQAMRDPI
jgi:hypothetical protein